MSSSIPTLPAPFAEADLPRRSTPLGPSRRHRLVGLIAAGSMFLAGLAAAQSDAASNLDTASDREAASGEVSTDDASPIAQGLDDIWVSLLAVPDELPEKAWVEVTSLAVDGPSRLFLLDRLEGLRRQIDPGIPQGPAMVCGGAPGLGTQCAWAFLYRGASVIGPPEAGDLEVPVSFSEGSPITGRYLQDGLPLIGVEVALVAADLDSPSAFIVPLEIESEESSTEAHTTSRLQRRVFSGEDGLFRLPPVGAGRYFLEARLPTGQVHTTEPFDLPTAAAVRQALGPDTRLPRVGARVEWDLGDIDVDLGLALEIQVSDPWGEPIVGALIQGRQGERPEDLQLFRLEADRSGRAGLSGLSAEAAIHLRCSAPGYTTLVRTFELAPVVFECLLEPLAGLRGSVVGLGGAPPPGIGIALQPRSSEPGQDTGQDPAAAGTAPNRPRSPASEPQSHLGAGGSFEIADVEPGPYELTIAAPGHEALHIEIDLEMGQVADVGDLVLAPGRPLKGLVVDADTGEPISGAEVRSVEPAGAVATFTDPEGELEMVAIGDSDLVLEVSASGYATTRARLSPAAQRADDPVRIALSEGGWIRSLVGGEGNPCVGCLLRIRPGNHELETDTRGEALSPALKAGWYEVKLLAMLHLGTAVVERGSAESRWVKVVAGDISTARFDTDRPELVVRFDRALPGRPWLSARASTRSQTVEPAADGSYLLRRKTGEHLELFLHTWDAEAGAEIKVRQATVPATFEGDSLTLRVSGARIIGRLRTWDAPGFGSPSANAAAGIRIRLRDIHHRGLPAPQELGLDRGFFAAELFSRPDGSFEISNIAPGVYTLILGQRSLQMVSVANRQTVDLGLFQLVPGSF